MRPGNIDHALLQSLSLPLLVSDSAGGILFANAAAVGFWSLPVERLLASTVEGLFGEDSPVSQKLPQVILSEQSYSIDRVLLFRQGRVSPSIMLVQMDPVIVHESSRGQVLISLRDHTLIENRRKTEEEKQRLGSISWLMGRMAHELRNPLSGVKGATQLLARQASAKGEISEFTAVILKEMERLERLIDNMLMNDGEPPLIKAPFNVHELLEEVVWFHQNAGVPVEIVRQYDPSLPDLIADRDRMHQVLLNLIQNGIQACPMDGCLIIRTHVHGPWLDSEGVSETGGTHFMIEISDNGPGISTENLEKLFTPFFSTKPEGRGLGLAICYQIINAHGGHLYHEAVQPRGARFVVQLPMAY